jgi:hypothetical protein
LIERIGISETLNLLAAVCAVKSFVEDDPRVRLIWSDAGVKLSDVADWSMNIFAALGTVSEG